MSKRPLSLVVAALVVALEGLVAVGLGAFAAVETVRGAADEVTAAIAEAVFGLLIGAGLLWVAWGGLLRAERWGRAPSVLTQIFMVPVAVTLIQSDQPLLGIPLIVVAVIGLGSLLAPPTTHALYGEE
ncbi:hypothetical protein [Nonomuraea lactucae]|uniref:hypothetical protein n=1 Tax=Nonomuraea lactucae TaxID=2249762 RepID=UPI000DE1E1DF|nr:hypothetical protein [Nonomuraea lactucae]